MANQGRVVDMLIDGLTEQSDPPAILVEVHVEGFDEPIRVWRSRMEIPAALAELAPAIDLDLASADVDGDFKLTVLPIA